MHYYIHLSFSSVYSNAYTYIAMHIDIVSPVNYQCTKNARLLSMVRVGALHCRTALCGLATTNHGACFSLASLQRD